MYFKLLALPLFVGLTVFVQIANADEVKKFEAVPAVKVGVVLGLTGFASEHADGMSRGIELALEDLRAKNELLLELEFQDDQTQPVKTVTAFRDLISRGVSFFIGPTWSFQIKAAKPFVERSNAIAIVPGGSSDVGGGPSPGMFFLSPNRSAAIPKLEEFFKNNNFKKAYLLTAVSDWGYVHEEVYRKALNEAGIAIVGSSTFDYSIDQSMLTPLMLRVKSVDADIILTTGPASDIFNMIRVRDNLRIRAALFGTENNWELVPRGLMKPSDLRNVFGMRAPTSQAFIQRYRARYGDDPKQYAAEAYDSVMVLNLLAKDPKRDRESVITFLQEKLDLQGMSGRIRFNEDGDIEDPKFEVLEVR